MTDETEPMWQCPRDGETMHRMGRRGGAWRCPTCRGVFFDATVMRRYGPGRHGQGQGQGHGPGQGEGQGHGQGQGQGQPPMMLLSVGLSLAATFLVRWLRHRRPAKAAPTAA